MENNQEFVNHSKKPSIIFILIAIILSSAITFLLTSIYFQSHHIISPLSEALSSIINVEKPLEKYSFERLAQTKFQPEAIVIGDVIEEFENFSSFEFSILVAGKKVTGQINIPSIIPPTNGFPIVVMNRGFIEPEIYQTGMGTQNAAAYYAQNGFVTIAPDFLGFGDSDQEDVDPMTARVEKPITTITILYSLNSLNQTTNVNLNHIFMWGHSNGGQITISVLEILGESPYWNQAIPTTLWAPVTKGFPYNILYYTDDGDYGKALRKELFEFELEYDTDNYSIHKFISWIDSPIQIHQGTNDSWIPTKWSQDFVDQLKEIEKDIKLFLYNEADHNLKPNWNTVVLRDVNYFNSFID
jgi:dienelactone hydrolase